MQSSKILDNKQNGKVGDELKRVIKNGLRISIMSAYFTIFAYKELKKELNKINKLRFLFTEPAFVNEEDKVNRKYYIALKTEKIFLEVNLKLKRGISLIRQVLQKNVQDGLRKKLK